MKKKEIKEGKENEPEENKKETEYVGRKEGEKREMGLEGNGTLMRKRQVRDWSKCLIGLIYAAQVLLPQGKLNHTQKKKGGEMGKNVNEGEREGKRKRKRE